MRARFDRWTSSQLAKFLIAGGISYVVNQIALVVLYEIVFGGMRRSADTFIGGLNPALLVSSIIAVEIAIIARFLINDMWTFRDRRDAPLVRRFVTSNVSSLGSPLISIAVVNILTPVFGINYLVANTIGVALGFGWNYVWSTKVVWRDKPTKIVPVRDEAPEVRS
jgi:putative flippase GtrA